MRRSSGRALFSIWAGLSLLACDRGLVAPAEGLHFVQVGIGLDHGCALTDDHRALCWGDDGAGQVSGRAGPYIQSPIEPFVLPARSSAVSAGGDVSCSTTTRGDLMCWGDSVVGQFRLGAAQDYLDVQPGRPTCALTVSRAAICWPRIDSAAIVIATGPFHDLGVGRTMICALQADSTAACWPADLSAAPSSVAGGFKFRTLSVGGAHACGMDADYVARCWGQNTFGQLGDYFFTPNDTPQVVRPIQPTTTVTLASVFAGDSHSCGIGTDGRAYCWGLGAASGINDPRTGLFSQVYAPRPVPSAIVWDTLMLGGGQTCGMSGGQLYCWGYGVSTGTPTPVPGQAAGVAAYAGRVPSR